MNPLESAMMTIFDYSSDILKGHTYDHFIVHGGLAAILLFHRFVVSSYLVASKMIDENNENSSEKILRGTNGDLFPQQRENVSIRLGRFWVCAWSSFRSLPFGEKYHIFEGMVIIIGLFLTWQSLDLLRGQTANMDKTLTMVSRDLRLGATDTLHEHLARVNRILIEKEELRALFSSKPKLETLLAYVMLSDYDTIFQLRKNDLIEDEHWKSIDKLVRYGACQRHVQQTWQDDEKASRYGKDPCFVQYIDLLYGETLDETKKQALSRNCNLPLDDLPQCAGPLPLEEPTSGYVGLEVVEDSEAKPVRPRGPRADSEVGRGRG